MKYYLQIVRHKSESEDHSGQVSIDGLTFQPLLWERLAALGIIESKNGLLTWEEAEKVQKILRIRQSLGVNLSGAAIIVDLMERLEELEDEIIYRRNS
jgi:MerR family transcriptional regulator/heat shock protein HspR